MPTHDDYVKLLFLIPAGQGTVVMVGSGLGFLGWLYDPANQFYGLNILGSTVPGRRSTLLLAFAKGLASVGAKIDAVHPGHHHRL